METWKAQVRRDWKIRVNLANYKNVNTAHILVSRATAYGLSDVDGNFLIDLQRVNSSIHSQALEWLRVIGH